MNLSTAVQQLEIPVSDFKAICQALNIAIVNNSIDDKSFNEVKVFVNACKERNVSISEGIQEILRLKREQRDFVNFNPNIAIRASRVGFAYRQQKKSVVFH